jgi:hypothetical protein
MMKKIYLTFAALIIVFACKAQHTNLTNEELFDGIKFNNVSLRTIMRSRGDLSQIKNLFGNGIQEQPNETGPFLAKEFFNENIYIHFEDETDSGDDYYLTYINVKNSSVLVQVKGISIRIGDDKSKFGRTPFNPNSSSFNFIDQDTGSVSLSFVIDSATNKVTEIKFIAF